MRHLVFSALILAVCTTVTAAEGDAEAPAAAAPAGHPGFAALDKDKDGFVNTEEAKGWSDLPIVFEHVDINHDGKLDNAEFSALEENLGGN